jgi:diguanylate cyclase (GGDEF)-like protein
MLASVAATVVAGYLTRRSAVAADAWVTHTDEVKIAIDECELALVRGDWDALGEVEAKVERLTSDNLVQQQRIARASLLTEQRAREGLEALFADMRREEDRLMVVRLREIQSARKRSSAAFLAGAVLTLCFAGVALAMLRAQRQDVSRQRALLGAILESVDEGIIAVEPASRDMLMMNAAARAMLGRSFPRDRLPEDWRAHVRAVYEDGSPMDPAQGPLARAMRGEESEEVVYRVVPADPRAAEPGVWVSTTARTIRDERGRIVAAVATLRDITEQRAQAERLRDESLTDELTGLLNRRGFFAAANASIAEARRTKAPMALLYADVNGLKRINDELGHEEGDRVIEDASRTLRTVFRGGDIVARIGGDEFVALLPDFAPAARDALLDRLAAAIRAHEQERRPFRLSLSYGVTLVDWERTQTLDDLLADADRKMYARKRERAGQSAPVLHPVRPGRG